MFPGNILVHLVLLSLQRLLQHIIIIIIYINPQRAQKPCNEINYETTRQLAATTVR